MKKSNKKRKAIRRNRRRRLNHLKDSIFGVFKFLAYALGTLVLIRILLVLLIIIFV